MWLRSRATEPPMDLVVAIGGYLNTAAVLGRRTGELHVQMSGAAEDGEAFRPEPYTAADLSATAVAMREHAEEQLALLAASAPALDDRTRELAQAVLERREELLQQIDELRELSDGAIRIRCHGDYHLGQVLVTEGDIVIFDFEGEPARPIAARRAKCSPLRDVAGMMRSFSYAALTALHAATVTRPEDLPRLQPWADVWETWVTAVFLRAYLDAAVPDRVLPGKADDREALLHAFTLEKALYELAYELNNRPDWVHIPLWGILRLRSPLRA